MRSIRDCSVAVTGGAGFLGSHLVDHLVEDRGCRVLVLDNLVAGRREFVHREAVFAHWDITGPEGDTRRLLEQYKIQYVFQYAAHPYVPDSIARPLLVFNVNAMGALKVINAAQEAGCEGILQVSSAELYGQGNRVFTEGTGYHQGRIDEKCPVEPHSSYGAAKAAIDALVPVRWKEAGTPVLALRQFNCLGERDTLHPYIVPECYKQLFPFTQHGGRRGTVRLGNDTSRDFLYAGDAVRLAVELLERGEWGQVYNSGSEESIKVYDLARLVGEELGLEEVEVVPEEARKRPWDIWHLQSDNTKLYRIVDYRPRVGLREALRRTVGYYRDTGWTPNW